MIQSGGGSVRLIAAIAPLVAALTVSSARAAPAEVVEQLGRLSLEELANVQVTSVARTPEPLGEAPASIYVISREDIRRSGAQSLPEVLRLAPNLEVAQINSASYTVTARGFNSPESANKLLVLIDGRSVYSPLASTVFWESLDLDLADVDRIEVVSGPGGTLWGANAVNGVINVVTRSAAETQGPLAVVSAGDRQWNGTVRYGGALGSAGNFRIYATGFDRTGAFRQSESDPSPDRARGAQGGFRFDGESGREAYTLQADVFENRSALLAMRLHGENVVGRWTHTFSPDSSVQLQAYFDQAGRDYAIARDLLDTYDLQLQDNLSTGAHRIVWGGEYRVWRSLFLSYNIFHFPQPVSTLSLGSVFVQDEITLRPDLRLTAGLKLEDNSYSGTDYLPNLRLAWMPDATTLIWSAVSRSVRTPSRIDRELTAPGILDESPTFKSETVTAFELGYRGAPTQRVSVSASLFYNLYDDIRSDDLINGGFPVVLLNGLRGHTYGLETWGRYSVTDWWRLSAGLSTLTKSFHLKPGHTDISLGQALGQDPASQLQVRSEMNLPHGVEIDVAARHVARILASKVPAYTEADARLGVRLTSALELSLDGRNLLHASHVEVIDPSTDPVRRIPREFLVSVRWRP